jgi:tRNA(fMet)-specific endonuclease VapC
MLDTNIASFLLRGQPKVVARVAATAPERLCLSAVTQGEILYGIARRPEAKKLRAMVEELLSVIDILPWTSATAQCYGTIRAELERRGKPLGTLDLMIAAHALQHDALLATSDRAFRMVPALRVEDWTAV